MIRTTECFPHRFVSRALVLLAFLCCIHLVGETAGATTYYVASSGSNSNPGTDPASPLAFSPGMTGCTSSCAGIVLFPGDSVLFNRGDIWRDRLVINWSGTSANQITYGAYGNGSNPVIAASDVLSGFLNAGSNIWDKQNVTTQPKLVIVNGALGTLVGSRSACTHPGDWFWGADTLSVFSTSDPSGKVQAGQRTIIVDTNGRSFLSINDLVLYGANSIGLYVRGSSNVVVSDLQSKWNQDVGYFIRESSDVIFNHDDAQANNNQGGFLADTGTRNLTFNNCTSSLNHGDGFALNGVTTATFNGGSANNNGTLSHEGNGIDIMQESRGTPSSNITINNFVSHDNLGNGLDVISVLLGDTGNTNIIVNGGSYYHNQTGPWLASGIRFDDNTRNSTVQYVKSYDNASAGIVLEAQSHDNAILYNRTWGNNNGITKGGDGGIGGVGNVFYGNVSYANTLDGFQLATSNGPSTIKNNIFYRNGRYGYHTDGSVKDVVDYNLNFGNMTANYSGISQPAHDVAADPLFTDASAFDFRLTASSPAIDAGTTLAAAYQLPLSPSDPQVLKTASQNSFGAGWEMGAFVYDPAGTASTRPQAPTGLTAIIQ